MDLIQTALLYQHSVSEERAERKEKAELIQALHERWVKNFQVWFDAQQMFSNPPLFKQLQEFKELAVHRVEIPVDEFPDFWKELTQTIPTEYIVAEPQADLIDSLSESNDPKINELLAGWVPHRVNK